MKGKVEELVRQLLREIRIIVGGTSTRSSSKAKKTYLQVVQNVLLSGRPPRMIKEDEPAIVFIDEDARWLHHPYDDEIVITFAVANNTTRRVLIDNGSSINILNYPTYQQIRINKELLRPVNVPLIRFEGMKVLPVGTISLLFVAGSYPWQINKEINFLVVYCSSSYNSIIGWPTLNNWRAATSTYHLSVKFQTKYGIGEVQGDQLATKKCYLAMLAMEKQMQTMTIEERRTLVKPIEVLEDVPLDEYGREDEAGSRRIPQKEHRCFCLEPWRHAWDWPKCDYSSFKCVPVLQARWSEEESVFPITR